MKKIITGLLIAFAVMTSAHAESYTNSTSIDVPEYNVYKRWNGWQHKYVTTTEGGTSNDVVGSSINVTGTSGTITDLNVTINGLNSKAFVDMTFVLVGPDNTSVVLSSNAGGANENPRIATPDVDLTFDDEASSQLPYSNSFNQSQNEYALLNSGSYQTSKYEMGSYYINEGQYSVLDPVADGFFGDPGNFAADNTLAAFDGIAANGNWQLLAFDNYSTDATSYNGWTLNFTTTSSSGGNSAVPEPAEWALIILACAGLTALKLHQRKAARAL